MTLIQIRNRASILVVFVRRPWHGSTHEHYAVTAVTFGTIRIALSMSTFRISKTQAFVGYVASVTPKTLEVSPFILTTLTLTINSVSWSIYDYFMNVGQAGFFVKYVLNLREGIWEDIVKLFMYDSCFFDWVSSLHAISTFNISDSAYMCIWVESRLPPSWCQTQTPHGFV